VTTGCTSDAYNCDEDDKGKKIICDVSGNKNKCVGSGYFNNIDATQAANCCGCCDGTLSCIDDD
jgi:hypothetical protein